MPDCISLSVRAPGVLAVALCAGLMPNTMPAFAIEVGFEGLVSLEASDNVEGADSPNEEDGSIQSVVLGVFGEQKSRRVSAAFQGELDTQKTNTDDDSDIDSIGRFLGAAEFKLTPRSWTWYVGDILGGVRVDDAIQPIDDNEITRRNVFVTGPAFEYEVQGISRTNARALYVNQTEDGEALETFFIADARHERDLSSRSSYGVTVGNIFTKVSSDDDDDDDDEEEEEEFETADDDFNRVSLSAFFNQRIGFLSLFAELGGTRFDTDLDSVTGFNAELRATQELGPQTSFSVFVQRDLNDQALSATESLLQSGNAAVGVALDASGIFTETRIGAEFNYQAVDTTIALSAGFADIDFELLTGNTADSILIDGEDRQQGFANATLSQRLSPQLRSELGVSYETQDFTANVRPDNSESVLLRAQLVYSLTGSFDLELGYTLDRASGLRTLTNGGVRTEDDIDVTENRVSVGLRWAPPSRASQELTVELRSLLQ